LAVLAPEREINIDQQVAILEDQILKRVAALAVAPAGAAEVVPVLDKAKAAGIPVVIVDTDVPWPARASFIGIDNKLGGRMAGEYLLKIIGGKGKVAVIRGVLGVATQEDRLAGFQEVIAKAPAVQCVAVQPANSERALGMGVMENILTSHPDLRAVFATNDQMALGAMEAIAARQLTGKVALAGFDATREALRAVEAGNMSAVVAQYPERIGRRAIQEAIKAARGKAVEKYVDIGTALVTRENVRQFLK
jgi:ribose transport system substrate-binding protein